MAVRGRRVLIVTEGSRGDIQPFIALALGLKAAGYVVKIATNCSHGPLVTSFGLDVDLNIINVEKVMREDPLVRDSMAKGKFPKFAAAIGKVINEMGPTSLAQQIATIKEFKPELMIGSALDIVHIKAIGYCLNIPVIEAALQVFLPTTKSPSPIFHDLDADWLPKRMRVAGWFLGHYLLCANEQEKVPIIDKELKTAEGGPGDYINSYLKVMYSKLNAEFRPIVASSPQLVTIGDDIPTAGRPIATGAWIIKASQQAEQVAKGNAQFGSKDESLALEKFLAAGEAPLYMGWGSMLAVSAEHMIEFATRVMMKVGKRGVVLGGFAHLSRSMLDKDEELKAFADKNVLFMDSASHESLLSRCSAIVHHGGKGTLVAAVRSGNPQVITPVFADQFNNAEEIQALGVGFAMPQFQKCTVDAVAKAVEACLTQPEIRQKAKELAVKVNAEDGVAGGVAEIHSAFKDIDSGKWKQLQAKNKAILLSKRCQRHPSCFAWLYRAFCMPDYNNYQSWVA